MLFTQAAEWILKATKSVYPDRGSERKMRLTNALCWPEELCEHVPTVARRLFRLSGSSCICQETTAVPTLQACAGGQTVRDPTEECYACQLHYVMCMSSVHATATAVAAVAKTSTDAPAIAC
eukprot:4126188-Pleurochrysis_carterae.AAC.2